MKRKKLPVLLATILLAGFFLGCNRSISAGSQAASAETDLGIKYARNFNIIYLGDGIKLVTDSGGNKLLLVPKGKNAPSGYSGAVLVETPITNAFYTSTTYVGLLGGLENDSVYDSVAAVCTLEEEWTTPQVLERFRSGKTRYINHNQMAIGDIEEIIKINPDIVFTSGNNDSDMQLRNMLDQVNIKHTTLLEWTEEGIAESLEWLKFFAAFFNLDEEADRIFESRLAHLNELYEKAANVSNRPTAAYGMIWDGTVYTQAGNSILAGQLEKAGGTYTLKNLEGDGSVVLTMEDFLNRCRDADILIYGSMVQYCPDKSFLLETEPLMAEFKAFKNDTIYIFQQGYFMNNAKVVEKFEDMVFIFHPELFPEHEMIFYQKLPD